MDIDNELEDWAESISSLIGKDTKSPSPTNPPTSEITYQAPIKGSFKNSGNFGQGDARHNGKHDGVDLRAPGGTQVYPLTIGTVISTNVDPKGGNTVRIAHPGNLITYYAHLGTVSVSKGQSVGYDTSIGTIGNSGNAVGTMPHVHFEVQQTTSSNDVRGTPVNPAKYFSIPTFTGTPSKDEVSWLSPEHKEQAQNFTMRNHVRQAKLEFSRSIERLYKASVLYYDLVTK